jgi:exopolysaccharide production protein ExoY
MNVGGQRARQGPCTGEPLRKTCGENQETVAVAEIHTQQLGRPGIESRNIGQGDDLNWCMETQVTSAAGKCQSKGLPLWKRTLDFVLVFALAPALLMVGALVAAVVKLGSRGPVLFKQRRVGTRGQLFMCFKFRTMQADAASEPHQEHIGNLIKSQTPMTKLDERSDPRLIPGGALLRSLGLDELPQVINVLRGEMSLVGPRPCIPYEFEMYDAWQKRRLEATPGLTGLWQVNGKNRTTFDEMVRLDIEYAEHMSFWLDLKIIIRTVPALWMQWRDLRAARRKDSGLAAGKSVQSINL